MARPRKHPEGTTGTDRSRLARARTKASGGYGLYIMLSPQGHSDLVAAKLPGETVKAVIERALALAAGRVESDGDTADATISKGRA